MKMERIFSWKFWEMDAKRREKLEKETGKKPERVPIKRSLKCLENRKSEEK